MFVILQAVAVLASLGDSGHILMYAPRNILAWCLAATRTWGYFKLWWYCITNYRLSSCSIRVY
ncbi:hypothetical protein CQA26_03915 [Providencia rettgeri]|nr:hypothetical protein CQA26_03915 [Providencia rettgeri]